MKIVHSLSEIQFDKNSVVTIGTFDGVHKAHALILKEVVRKANAIAGRSVVVTFEPHPREIVSVDKKIDLLLTFDEKAHHIEKFGIDYLFVIPFSYEFSRKSYSDFYKEYIVNGIGVSAVVEGFNHHLGKDREGGINQIIEIGKEFNFTVDTMSLLTEAEHTISSSTIRKMLLRGNVKSANIMLGYEYNFTGVVVRGHGRGRQLGYPTANIRLNSSKKLIPNVGVYAVKFFVGEKWYDGMMSIGKLPTFYDNHELTTEVNIFDFNSDIYDEVVSVKVIDFIRDQLKFSSVDELIREMGNDKVKTEKILKSYSLIN